MKSQLFRKFQILALLSLFAFSGGANIFPARTSGSIMTEWVVSNRSKTNGRLSFSKTANRVNKPRYAVSSYGPELKGIVFVHDRLTFTRLRQISKNLFSAPQIERFIYDKIIPQNNEEEFLFSRLA